jgi:hypothetical protein
MKGRYMCAFLETPYHYFMFFAGRERVFVVDLYGHDPPDWILAGICLSIKGSPPQPYLMIPILHFTSEVAIVVPNDLVLLPPDPDFHPSISPDRICGRPFVTVVGILRGVDPQILKPPEGRITS